MSTHQAPCPVDRLYLHAWTATHVSSGYEARGFPSLATQLRRATSSAARIWPLHVPPPPLQRSTALEPGSRSSMTMLHTQCTSYLRTTENPPLHSKVPQPNQASQCQIKHCIPSPHLPNTSPSEKAQHGHIHATPTDEVQQNKPSVALFSHLQEDSNPGTPAAFATIPPQKTYLQSTPARLGPGRQVPYYKVPTGAGRRAEPL